MVENGFAKLRADHADSAAYHEAGHTTLAALEGLCLQERGVHVDPEGSGISYYWHRIPGDPSSSERDQLEREHTIVALYAGKTAQVRFFPGCPEQNWESDMNVIRALLEEMHPIEPCAHTAAQDALSKKAKRLVDQHWAAIRGLALNLLSKPWTRQPPAGINENWSHGKTTFEKWMTGSEAVTILKSFKIEAQIRRV